MTKNKNGVQYHGNTPAISISNLNIRYQHKWVFDNFEFHLPLNQWTCLLGPSGTGKTSLLRFLAELPHEKGIEYSGDIITSDNKSLKGKLTYMTQQDSLLPWLNILDNVLIGFRLRNEKITNSLKHQAKTLLKRSELIGVSKLKPHQLSQGMRQRVTLVRSLIENRQIVLMDEPFSALDVITKSRIQTLAATLLAGRTVLLVTHDPLEALRLGHNVYIITGSPAKISDVIKPQGRTPRNFTDTNLLVQQARLLEMLAEDKYILN